MCKQIHKNFIHLRSEHSIQEKIFKKKKGSKSFDLWAATWHIMAELVYKTKTNRLYSAKSNMCIKAFQSLVKSRVTYNAPSIEFTVRGGVAVGGI